ncbi:formate dehydrogenase subunit alpha [bacterium]|nr:MAG: formate dehydrogenase subunit alpha [bacterium]
MTNSIDDLGDNCECFLVIGSNTTENHPVIGDRVKKAVTQRGAKLIVIDPRRIPLVDMANVYLQVPPGYNIPVIAAMANVILAEGLEEKAYVEERCEGFDEFKASIAEFTPEKVSAMTAIPAEDIKKAARLFATAKPSAILYAMGVTQFTQGTASVRNLANLAMLTGNVGVSGGGVNPLRGQNNVQGACDMGGLPNVFTGYQNVEDEAARAKFEKAWGVTLPAKQGMKLTEVGQELGKKIKALYIMGENPMLTDPDLNHLEHGLEKLDLLVVQDIFMTETACRADVVLPTAAFAEKEGTFSNTERRVQRVRKVVQPPGSARPDSEIITGLSARMGCELGSPEPRAVFAEIRSLTPSYAGISYERIENDGIQWPCPDESHKGTEILHVGKFTRGKGAFSAVSFSAPAEVPDEKYPFIMTTGREQAHYHSGSMTRNSRKLSEVFNEGGLEMNPADAKALGVATGETVAVASRRGEITVKVRVTDNIGKGKVFMTFHYSESPVNVLTNTAYCPTAKIPELKVTAVAIRKV